MKNIIKDRKTLSLALCLVLVSVFTLTIAYSALSAVLTIQGNARVSAANWDIYLNNPRVTSGSATTNLPQIKTSSTLEFETTLNMPGDFYEFVVDVVNGGDIDAMIENVVKTPELTTEQAKFLKYEITYQNNEPITTKQLLAKDTTMPIKVRVEYRKDLNNTDLPTSQVVLDLALTLEYTQSDGNGSSVAGDGKLIYANGDIDDIGTIVTIGTEQFYTIGIEGNNVKLFAMYNLLVGSMTIDAGGEYASDVLIDATGIQDSKAIGECDELPFYGIVDDYWDPIDEYISDYNSYINELGIIPIDVRYITSEELISLGCDKTEESCSLAPSWVYSTAYWVDGDIRNVGSNGYFGNSTWDNSYRFGVRPVIVISKDYF